MGRSTMLAMMVLVLAACQREPDENFAIDETNTANAEIETLPPDEGNDQTAEANAVEPPTTILIPAAFHGRWGMVPADCTSTRGDAKGLIAIDPTSIQFYESRATLTEATGSFPENFTGTFAFAGEGQNWTKAQNLKLTGSSNTLIRTETDPAASFTYKRCT
jgi:hypothetical protein